MRKALILAVTLVAVFAAAAVSPAQAKARHPKADSDKGGLFMPPAPETKPVFVMTGVMPKPPQGNTIVQQMAQLQGPTGSAMGKEKPPSEDAQTYHSDRTVESLHVPLLFK